ncbi:evbL [uncultured Mycolicibacterium sp.]|uniref:SCO6745 family protein n=1 Tax=uncultured Mycolicibacterium sp. TaxID=2320817 RepID=UPI00260A893E|nr:evbL [uncultured Mycolicibacterium sp.]
MNAIATVGAAMEQAVAAFMLHPETFAASVAAGYQNPMAGYVAGRAGVLGEASGTTVASVFVVFEPNMIAALWQEGIAVRGARGAAEQYWAQAADFGRKYLAGAAGLDRICALSEKVIAAAPAWGVPLFAGWREMPLAQDAPARALQVMFVLRELRAAVHFNALTVAGIAPIEAHLLNKGRDYAAMFGWPEPFPDPAAKKDRYAEVEAATDRRMGEILGAALTETELAELARLSEDALATLRANLPG